jgi:hypothetical protein
MAIVLTVERKCPKCDKLFRAPPTVELQGEENTRIESPCPDCGTPGRAAAEVRRFLVGGGWMKEYDTEYETLGALIAADEAAGERQVFVLISRGLGQSGYVFVGHPGWAEETPAPSPLMIDELADLGWVRVTSQGHQKARNFSVTSEGRRAWAEHSSALAPKEGPEVDLAWSEARQVLDSIYKEYVKRGAPDPGVDLLSLFGEDGGFEAKLPLVRALIQDDYLDVSFESAAGPRIVTPTPKTLQLVAGWPTGPDQDALDQLVAALDKEIGRTPDAESRSKLQQVRDGLLGVGRAVFLAWLEQKAQGL